MAGYLRGIIVHCNLTHHINSFVERSNDRIQGSVDSLDDRPEVTAVLSGIGPDIQFACDCSLGQHVGIGNHGLHRVDAHVEVILDLIEVTVIGIGDLRRDVALGYPVHVLRSNV